MDDRDGDLGRERVVVGEASGLSDRQARVVRELGRGKGVVAAARAVGVSRVTVYRWMQEPMFVAAMNRWRGAMVRAAHGQIVAMLGEATKTVRDAVKQGDAKIAMQVLARMGALEQRVELEDDLPTAMRRQDLEQRADRVALDRIDSQLDAAEEHNQTLRDLQVRPGKVVSPTGVWEPWLEPTGFSGPAKGAAEKGDTPVELVGKIEPVSIDTDASTVPPPPAVELPVESVAPPVEEAGPGDDVASVETQAEPAATPVPPPLPPTPPTSSAWPAEMGLRRIGPTCRQPPLKPLTNRPFLNPVEPTDPWKD